MNIRIASKRGDGGTKELFLKFLEDIENGKNSYMIIRSNSFKNYIYELFNSISSKRTDFSLYEKMKRRVLSFEEYFKYRVTIRGEYYLYIDDYMHLTLTTLFNDPKSNIKQINIERWGE